jgi:hypothetical protein
MSNAKPDPVGAVKFIKREVYESPYLNQEELKDRLRAFVASSQCWDFLVEFCASAPRDLWTDQNRLAKHMHDWLSVRAKDPGQGGLRLFMDQYGFAVCGDLGEMFAGYYREEIDRQQLTFPKKNRRGRPRDPKIQLRKKILREMIKNISELNDPQKRRNLFARFHREGAAKYSPNATDWIDLQHPFNRKELDTTLSNLRKDFTRR